jgi:hypothetical protein
MPLRRADRVALALGALLVAIGLAALAISIDLVEDLGGFGAAVRLVVGG